MTVALVDYPWWATGRGPLSTGPARLAASRAARDLEALGPFIQGASRGTRL